MRRFELNRMINSTNAEGPNWYSNFRRSLVDGKKAIPPPPSEFGMPPPDRRDGG